MALLRQVTVGILIAFFLVLSGFIFASHEFANQARSYTEGATGAGSVAVQIAGISLTPPILIGSGIVVVLVILLTLTSFAKKIVTQ